MKLPSILISIALACLLTGCETLDRYRPQINATGSVLARKAASMATRILVSSATSWFQQEGRKDYTDAFAQGLRTIQGTGVITSEDVRQVASIWLPREPVYRDLGNEVASIFDRARTGDPRRDSAAVEQIARGLNRAAK